MKTSINRSTASIKVSFILLFALLGLAGQVSEIFAELSGTFIATGNLLSPRSNHTATLLSNGRVLIAGGTGNSTPLSSAELYDPDTGLFIRTGSMSAPRTLHTATLLADGRVLVAGGYDPSWKTMASAELYDPTSGTFTPTGTMINAQIGHTATLLHNGKVLITGGLIAAGPVVASTELYDPASGTFSAIPWSQSLVWPTATLLPDGKVLTTVGTFAGSVGSARGAYDIIRLSFESSQLFDPVANTFAATGYIPLYTTYWHTATLLKNGMVLIAGGGDGDEGLRSASASLFDPDTRTFSETANMTTPRVVHTATLLNDGTVLITGGPSMASTELYDPSNRTFTSTASMSEERIGHTATLLNDGNVLIAGGNRINSRSAEIYRPLLLLPTSTVRDVQFDRTDVAAGTSYSVTISGSNMTPETFFDVRFSIPGSDTYAVVLNWQQGPTASHSLAPGSAVGTWTINGVRAHQEQADHTGDFSSVNATITVLP
jgi:hypothetical protein